MPEFNFFKPFIPAKKKKNYKKFFVLILLISFVIPVGYYHWNMLIQLNQLNSDIESIQSFISDPSNVAKVEEVIRKQETVDQYLLIRDQFLNSKAQINSEFQVAAYLLDLINTQMPNELFLTKMSLDNGHLNIEGYCNSFETVAQYAYNLRVTGMFTEIDIPTVVKQENAISFIVEGTIKGGGIDEAK